MKTRGFDRYVVVLSALIIIVKVIFSVEPVSAIDNQGLIINEIYANPNTGEKEWLELFNNTAEIVDLSNYQLKDGGVAAKNIEGELLPGNYYLYEANSGWLNNSAEIIFLINKQDNSIEDMVAYGDWQDAVLPQNINFDYRNNAEAPSKGRSLSRIPNSVDSDISLLDFKTTLPTPLEENILPQYSNQIKIWEVMPEPEDGVDNEYIELLNISDQQIDLEDWCLDDAEGGSEPYCFGSEEYLGPNQYKVIYYSQSKISLSDNGDCARLIDPNGEVKDSVSYDKSIRGQSYSFIDNKWSWSTTLTAGLENKMSVNNFQTITDNVPLSISSAKLIAIGERVLVNGKVSVLPGVLSKQYFYIQDDSGGIQIYSYSAQFPELNIGDVIRVVGEISQIAGEKRIKISSSLNIDILEALLKRDEAIFVNIDDISDDYVGVNIATTGVVKETSGSTFIIAETKELKVIIKSSTQIKKPRMKKNQKVYVEGILSVYNGQYRLLPYDINGVKILTSGNLPITGRQNTIWNVFPIIKIKQPDIFPRSFPSFVVGMYCAYPVIWAVAKQWRLKQLQNVWV